MRAHLGCNPRSREVSLLPKILLECCFWPVSAVSCFCCLCSFVVFCLLLFLWRKDIILVRFEWRLNLEQATLVSIAGSCSGDKFRSLCVYLKFCKSMKIIIVNRNIRVPN